ncbi:MAG: hypothetical protein KC416_01130, partial [Myxococcales bacterium]|nr:hypothetical protein [Myxococcales bacterium]
MAVRGIGGDMSLRMRAMGRALACVGSVASVGVMASAGVVVGCTEMGAEQRKAWNQEGVSEEAERDLREHAAQPDLVPKRPIPAAKATTVDPPAVLGPIPSFGAEPIEASADGGIGRDASSGGDAPRSAERSPE